MPSRYVLATSPGPAVAGAGDVDDVQIVLLDQPIEMNIDEIQPGRRAPVAEQARLDVFDFQRLVQQRIRVEIYLPHGEVVRGTPVGVHLAQFFFGQGLLGFVRLC